MLSGESTPQSKESVFHREAASIISPDDDKQHWLFGGTKVLQVTAPSSEESPLPPRKSFFSLNSSNIMKLLMEDVWLMWLEPDLAQLR